MLGLGLEPTSASFVTATWAQDGTTLDVTLSRAGACRAIAHQPVIQLERVERKAGQAVYWEYGIGAVFLAIGLMGLIRPTLFSRGALTQDGQFVEESETGIGLGAVFTSLAVIPLAAGVADTIRSRDSVYEHEAFRVEYGPEAPCPGRREPLFDRAVTLEAGTWRAERRTDAGGRVQFDVSASSSPMSGDGAAILRWEDHRTEVRFSDADAGDAVRGSVAWYVPAPASDAPPAPEAASAAPPTQETPSQAPTTPSAPSEAPATPEPNPAPATAPAPSQAPTTPEASQAPATPAAPSQAPPTPAAPSQAPANPAAPSQAPPPPPPPSSLDLRPRTEERVP